MGNIFKPPCDEAVILSSPAENPCTKSAEPWILAATILGSSLAFIDGTVVNVALPALQKSLHATVLDVQWVVEAYALFLAALLLLGGSLGDRFGRRFIYAIGIGIFAFASAWCGLAPNIQQLIVARAIQGIGGALLVPGSLAIIAVSFEEKRRGQAIGTWSGFTSITSAIGPLIGGWVIDHVSWRAAFFINIPIAFIVLLILIFRVPENRHEVHQRELDWKGATLITAGLGIVVYGLIESSKLGFGNPKVLIAITSGIFLIAIFLLLESKIKHPMVPLNLFRGRNFTGANLLTFFLYSALSGALFFYPLNLIQVQGYSSTAAGASFLPFILILFFLSRWSGKLALRYGARLLLVIGSSIAGVGFLLFILPGTQSNYWTDFSPAIAVLGLGMGISVAPLTTTVMNSVKQTQAGIASGINNSVSRIAGLLAVAIFGVVMLQNFRSSLDQHPVLNQAAPAVRATIKGKEVNLAAIEIPANLSARSKSELRYAIQDSFVSSFRWIMLLAAGLAFASSMTAWRTLRTDEKNEGSIV